MRIQPGDFGTSLNTWFRLLGRRWKPLLISSLAAYVPVAVLVAALYFVADLGDVFAQLSDPNLVNDITVTELADLVAPVLVAGLIAAVVQLIATAYIYLTAARIVAQHHAELESDWREVSRFAWGRLATAIGASFLVFAASLLVIALVAGVSWALIANLGTTFVSVFLTSVIVLTTIVMMIWLGVSVSLYTQSVALTRNGVIECIKESFFLVQGRWWVTVGFVLVTSLIASAVLQVLSLALAPLYVAGTVIPGVLAVGVSLTTLIQGPVIAAIGAAYGVWYIDLRARRDPLDAESLVL
jgi:hypothetical protein